MVRYTDVQQLTRTDYLFSEGDILLAGNEPTGRMVMCLMESFP